MTDVKRAAKPHKVKPSGKVAIVVLGMHRSGTSMLAGILDRLGCMGPKTQLEANEKNPKGFFESEPIFRLNDEILAAAGTSWNDWQPLREGWLDSPRFNEFRARAVDVLRDEYGDASMIYLKDPRICRLLPFWQHALEEMGCRVVCIHTHRHPADVATSLKARKNIEVEPSLGMLSWLRHVLDAEPASRDVPRIFTSYAGLIDDWQGFAKRAEEAFGLTWPVVARTAQERVAQLIDPRLRHHESSIEAFLRDPLVPEMFRKTLLILESWTHEGENRDDRAKLEGLRNDFDLSAPLLYAPISALEVATRDVKALTPHKATAEARQIEVEALTTKLADAEGQRDQLSSQQEQLRAELDQSRADIEKAKAQAKADEAEAEALTTKLAEAEGNASKLLDEITTGTDRLIDKDKKIAKLQQDADLNRREQAVKEAELNDLQHQHVHAIEDLHNIYTTSTSWKVSAPLRFIRVRLWGRR